MSVDNRKELSEAKKLSGPRLGALRQAAVKEREKLLVELRKAWDKNGKRLESLRVSYRESSGAKSMNREKPGKTKNAMKHSKQTPKISKTKKHSSLYLGHMANGERKGIRKNTSSFSPGSKAMSLKRSSSNKSNSSVQRKRSASLTRELQQAKRYNYAITELTTKRRTLALKAERFKSFPNSKTHPHQPLPGHAQGQSKTLFLLAFISNSALGHSIEGDGMACNRFSRREEA